MKDTVNIIDCFKYYQDKINITTSLKELNRDFQLQERTAFFNALWFFSYDFYSRKELNEYLLLKVGEDYKYKVND